jgi:hypothetical protein
MRKALSLVLVLAGLPCLAASAAIYNHVAHKAAGGKVTIDRASARAFLSAPGAPAAPLALRLVNSANSSRFVTKLTVAVGETPADCPSRANLRIAQSNVSRRRPLRIPANRAVTLPVQGVSAPTIQLLDRPVDQDDCKEARFPLRFKFSEGRRR